MRILQKFDNYYMYNEKKIYIIFLANGLKFAFDVKTTLNISDIAFYPSQTTHSYDIYASSIDKEDILFLDLTTGEIIFSLILSEIILNFEFNFRNN